VYIHVYIDEKGDSVILAKLVESAGGAAELAQRCRVSESTIRHALTGFRPLSSRTRAAIELVMGVDLETGIPTRHGQRKPPRAPAPAPSRPRASGKVSGVEELRATLALYDQRISDARVDGASPSVWAHLLQGRATTCDKLARLQGEGELTMAMIVRSKVWLDIRAALRPVFEKYPEAATEIAEALEALEAT
jgi:hypothetical protein